MKEFRFPLDACSKPANTNYYILPHPSGNLSKSTDLAIFNEHRFAFFYWIKWNAGKNIIPDLITFDWHQDLAYPEDLEKEALKKLVLSDLVDVSIFSWARLNPLNDNHILSAAYLNQINNIWVVCKQTSFNDWGNKNFIDMYGGEHIIRIFRSHKDLLFALQDQNVDAVFFDIDLDYFTNENSTSNSEQRYTYMTKKQITDIFTLQGTLMQWIFQRMSGFTIALEPEHTGGLIASLNLFKIVQNQFFEKSPTNWHCSWKHLTV